MRSAWSVCFWLGVATLFIGPACARADSRPNIVVIVMDDAGYADFGFHGSADFETPNLDRLAARGVRLSAGYVTAAVCGPSRAGLFTGRYPQRFGFEANNAIGALSPVGLVGSEAGLPVGERTLGDWLHAEGYRTAFVGKWHLGGTAELHPLERGFDEFYGLLGGARPYRPIDDGASPMLRLQRGREYVDEHFGYLTNELGREAERIIARQGDDPYLLVLSFTAVHTPIQARAADLERFESLPDGRRQLASMTFAMDRAIGRVLAAIAERGDEERTLLFAINDNGGASNTTASDNAPFSGIKDTHLEGGIRVPFLVHWPGRLPAGAVYDAPTSSLDIVPTALAAAGIELPEGLDGVDLLPFLRGEREGRPHERLFWRAGVRAAVREGDWKLIRLPDRPAELYDLAADPSETQNLAAQQPERVRALYRELFVWESTLARPRWQLQVPYDADSMRRYDAYRRAPVAAP